MKKKTKIRLVILILVMAAGIGLLLWKDIADQRRQQTEYKQKDEQLRPLRVEKRQLEQELDDLEDEYDLLISGAGTATVLFTDLDERIYTDIYPVMEDYGFEGMLAISADYLPDGEGRMTSEQIRELLDAGWVCCPTWQTDGSMQSVQHLETILTDLEAAPSHTVYFEDGAYSQIYDGELAAAGYTSVIHHGEEDLPLVTSEVSGGIWHPGAVGLQGEEPRFRLEDAVAEKANIIFTVSYVREEEMYNSNPFTSMLDYLSEYSARSELTVTQPEAAREYFQNISRDAETVAAEYDQKREELERQMQDIEAQIEAVE